jgi:hypothetical protein
MNDENVNIEVMEAAWRKHNDASPTDPMSSFDFFAAGYKAQSERMARLEAALEHYADDSQWEYHPYETDTETLYCGNGNGFDVAKAALEGK